MPSTRDPGRFAGLLYLLISLPGAFSLIYVPDKMMVSGNAAATAANIVAFETLFRVGIAVQLVFQGLFIFVALALYDLLEGVNRRHASLMVILIALSVPITFVNELNSVAALLLARGGDVFTAIPKEQRDALVMLFMKLHSYGFDIAGVFWGLWLFPLALLVYRSRFIPRLLGAWLALAGIGWVAMSLTAFVFPEYRSTMFMVTQPASFGEVAFMLWLIVRGARPPEDATKLASAA
jgi:Domain of unknown function (DUF4386)